MKIHYIDEYETIIYKGTNAGALPRVGDTVCFDDIFFVKSIVWYPTTETVIIHLDTEHPDVATNPATKTSVIDQSVKDVALAKKQSAEALKEATNLKRQVFSIRQYLKTAK